ncbi:MAG: biopolymer transporter ExbD [Steroidobacteraceae bacterium]
MNLRKQNRDEPEINLINMIDVLLVLLIFFMVSSTFQQEGRMIVRLPQANEAPLNTPQPPPLTLTVTAEGSYRVNDKSLINNGADTLRAALLKEAGSARGPLTIRADGRASHQSVVTAMDVAGRLGFTQMNIATVQPEASP